MGRIKWTVVFWSAGLFGFFLSVVYWNWLHKGSEKEKPLPSVSWEVNENRAISISGEDGNEQKGIFIRTQDVQSKYDKKSIAEHSSILMIDDGSEAEKKNEIIFRSTQEKRYKGKEIGALIQNERVGDFVGSYVLTRKVQTIIDSNIFFHAHKDSGGVVVSNTGSNYLDRLLQMLPLDTKPTNDLSERDSDAAEEGYKSKYAHGNRPFAGGAYGSVWLAEKRDSQKAKKTYDSNEWRQSTYVLKKISVLSDGHRMAAMREVHFGMKFAGHEHIARFVEYFETHDAIWLVFFNEGRSLHDLLYTRKDLGNFEWVVRSSFWKWLREDKNGHVVMREIWRDILRGVQTIHAKKTTHRDIKPSNIFIHQDKRHAAVLGDFGSSLDKEALTKWYSMYGPSKNESSLKYAPPEVVFGQIPFSFTHPGSYDLWSIGVLFLEMWLGQSNVFELDQRVAARIDRNFPEECPNDRRFRHLLMSFKETCIYENYPTSDPTHPVTSTVCLQKFGLHVKRLDPLGKGLDDDSLDLIQKLLQWNPINRISANEALKHKCFQNLGEVGVAKVTEENSP